MSDSTTTGTVIGSTAILGASTIALPYAAGSTGKIAFYILIGLASAILLLNLIIKAVELLSPVK
ncbi:MAG: hypothetical protein ABIC57_04155 [bacterium]